jgi:hypothetical protein
MYKLYFGKQRAFVYWKFHFTRFLQEEAEKGSGQDEE